MIRNYFSIHHRFLAWIGQLTNLVVISPHPTAIGNASEDYYFGLLKARYEAKKLLVLFPYPILRQPSFAPALLFLQSDFLAIRFGGPVSIILNCIWTAYFLCLSFVKPMLAFICRIQLSGYYWRPLVGQDILWRPAPEIIKFDWELLKKQEFSKQLSIPIELSLPKKKNEYCVAERKNLGLPENAWFVCLHVREGGYSGDIKNFRNADIFSYIGAIREITQQGGWVVRMGDPSMKKLPKLDQVIDYPFTTSRSALMDVYLLKNCVFYIGTSSGITDTALMLSKPVVLTNMTHYINLLPQKSGDITIFKHIYSVSKKRYLSIQEWLLSSAMITRETWSSPDWVCEDNTAVEISAAVYERLNFEKIKKSSELQAAFKKEHMNAVLRMSKLFRFDESEVENCNEWYRHGSRMIDWKGIISEEYLKRNWHISKSELNRKV